MGRGHLVTGQASFGSLTLVRVPHTRSAPSASFTMQDCVPASFGYVACMRLPDVQRSKLPIRLAPSWGPAHSPPRATSILPPGSWPQVSAMACAMVSVVRTHVSHKKCIALSSSFCILANSLLRRQTGSSNVTRQEDEKPATPASPKPRATRASCKHEGANQPQETTAGPAAGRKNQD